MKLCIDRHDGDCAIADLWITEEWNREREAQALAFAREKKATFVLVWKDSTCERVLLVAPDVAAA